MFSLDVTMHFRLRALYQVSQSRVLSPHGQLSQLGKQPWASPLLADSL